MYEREGKVIPCRWTENRKGAEKLCRMLLIAHVSIRPELNWQNSYKDAANCSVS